MSRPLVALLVSFAAGVAVVYACSTPSNTKKTVSEACTKNLDCNYGLECVAPEGSAAGADTDAAIVQGRRTCQYKSFGDCDSSAGDGDGGGVPAAAQTSGQQCLSGYRCRDGKCTVMCAGKSDCREGEVCRIGVCQRTGGRAGQIVHGSWRLVRDPDRRQPDARSGCRHCGHRFTERQTLAR